MAINKKKQLSQLSKAELVRLATTRCEHRHLLIEHPQCATDGNNDRIGFWDLETTNLDADYGFILSWAIKPLGSDEILYDVVTTEDISKAKKGDEDKRIVGSLVEALYTFDMVVGYYSSKYDGPYARTRAIVCGVDFPPMGAIAHHDLYYSCKFKLKLSRNGLENACRTVLGTTEKNHISGELWRRAARGDQKALEYVLDHNLRDVRDTERFYLKMLPFSRIIRKSL